VLIFYHTLLPNNPQSSRYTILPPTPHTLWDPTLPTRMIGQEVQLVEYAPTAGILLTRTVACATFAG
jgi:hypothetical protein